MPWKLFLDDVRQKPDDSWTQAWTAEEGQELILKYGIPNEASFDHDLGYTVPDELKKTGPVGPFVKTQIGYMRKGVQVEMTGYDLAKWIVEMVKTGKLELPSDFTYHVHSANPVGAGRIRDELYYGLKVERRNRGEWWRDSRCH